MLGAIIFTIVSIILINLALVYIVTQSNKFWDSSIKVEEKLKNVSTYEEGFKLLEELQRNAFHKYHTQRVKELNLYLKGRFNLC